jgi:hypothetical protein
MSVRRNIRGRLRFYTLVSMDGVEHWDLTDLPEIPVRSDDRAYVILGTDRIDLVAKKFYGDPVLWWVIALANNMELLPGDFIVGSTIRIPAPRYVLQELLRRSATSQGRRF